MKTFSLVLLALALAASPCQADFQRLRKSVLKMDFQGQEGYCTVFAVTPDGYFLTALHCVRDCLLENGAAEEASDTFLGLLDLFVVREPRRTQVTCRNLSIPALGMKEIQVVATGSALSFYEPKFLGVHSELLKELQTRGWESKANDYAVIKVPGRSGMACLPLGTAAPAPGSELRGVGFPLPEDPKATPVLVATPGRLYGMAEEGRFYQSKKTDLERLWVRTQFNAPDVLYSNAATTYGHSGGPILAADDSILGVISGFSETANKDRTSTHELTGGSIQKILAELPAELSTLLQVENRKCR